MAQDAPKDFFISYTGVDRQWAEWIAWQLEQAGFSVVLQAWDFRPGSNFVLEMHKASQPVQRTIAILSAAYLQASYTKAEWAAAFRNDPTGEQGLLLPVRIEQCDIEGLLGPLVYIDLVGLSEQAARERLLAGIKQSRAKPTAAPNFPGKALPIATSSPRFPGTIPPVWNVPSQRNLFFTGREQVLVDLHAALGAGKTSALTQSPQAISGLGGIGKTQTAIEYAYRFASEYEAVLWAKAESRETLVTDYVSIASLLNLPEKDEPEQSRVVAAVKRWLTQNGGWLLILDNADDLRLAKEFYPPASRGHILLTTRAQFMSGLAQRIELAKMGAEEGSIFLLRRANLIAPTATIEDASMADRTKAGELVQLMDGLPLALDQAGAYIEETACGLAHYLQIYRTQRVARLKERGGLVPDHPEPVATTWSLSFKNVEQANAAAADLLRFCTFLAPDAIPEELLTESAAELGPLLQPMATDPSMLDDTIRELLKYSLVHRDPESKTLSIHRLVQEVLKDQMNEETQRQWAERTVRAVNRVFPNPEYANWDRCQRYLLHAQVCSSLIEQWNLLFTEAAALLNKVGYYQWQRGEYEQVESLHKRALAIREQVLGLTHLDTAVSLVHLGFYYHNQGKYTEALPLYQRALPIYEKELGPTDPELATSLNNLAELYRNQGKYTEALPLYERALAIREKEQGPTHPDMAQSLNNLALLYYDQDEYAEALPLFQRSLTIREQELGPTHPDTALSLNNLANIYNVQGKYEQASPLYQRALTIYEQELGPEHPDTAWSVTLLAWLYENQGKYDQAKPLYQRALAICEKVLGTEHPDTVRVRRNYEDLLQRMKGKK